MKTEVATRPKVMARRVPMRETSCEAKSDVIAIPRG